jgi:hypothetical protein
MGYQSWQCRLLEMFQHKIVTMHQDITNQNTNLLSRINFLEQANANQSRQLLNLQKKMETADEVATQDWKIFEETIKESGMDLLLRKQKHSGPV